MSDFIVAFLVVIAIAAATSTGASGGDVMKSVGCHDLILFKICG